MKKNRKERRKIRLIKPRLQFKLIGVFVGISAFGFILQSLHVAFRLSDLAASMPEGGASLMAVLPELPIEILIFSFGMVLPLTIAIGIFITHRIAGPVYRFEQYLTALSRGEYHGPCRIRNGDELQELCTIINQAVEALREEQLRDREEPEPEPEPATGELLRKAG